MSLMSLLNPMSGHTFVLMISYFSSSSSSAQSPGKEPSTLYITITIWCLYVCVCMELSVIVFCFFFFIFWWMFLECLVCVEDIEKKDCITSDLPIGSPKKEHLPNLLCTSMFVFNRVFVSGHQHALCSLSLSCHANILFCHQ